MQIFKKQIPKKTLVLVLLVPLLISLLGTVMAFQASGQTVIQNELFSYQQESAFEYTVELKPNSLYENSSITSREGGIYFTEITDQILVKFQYNYSSSLPTTVTGRLATTTTLKSQLNLGSENTILWEKKLQLTPNAEVSIPRGTATVDLAITISNITSLIDEIEKDILVTSNQKTLAINVVAYISGSRGSGTFADTLNSTMNINFRDRIIEITEPLTQQKNRVITEEKMGYDASVTNWRILTTGSFAGLLLFTSYELVHKEKNKRTWAQSLLDRYHDLIVESAPVTDGSTGLGNMITGTIIEVRSIEDLVHVAEQAAKPIMHSRTVREDKIKHCFYVVEGAATYRYCTEEQDSRPPAAANKHWSRNTSRFSMQAS